DDISPLIQEASSVLETKDGESQEFKPLWWRLLLSAPSVQFCDPFPGYINCFTLLMLWLCWILDAVLTIEPKLSSYFIGEFVTFKCDMNEGEDTDWYYAINKDGQEVSSYRTNKDSKLEITSTSYSGEYQCTGRRKSSHDKKNSNTVSITVLGKSSVTDIGGSVTLTCSVQSSDGWKYEWFRQTQRTSIVKIRDQQNRDIRVSEGGIYSCRGARGNPVYYTDINDDVTIEITCEFSHLMMSRFIVTIQRDVVCYTHFISHYLEIIRFV
uniref:Ig-like domain-containing protein n=1 Tax=Pundamilia nyererei TaxID=303518 RepID=A0A3B4GH71_9CICH